VPKLYSSKFTVKILKKNNFIQISQKGSHAKFKKICDENIIIVIVPMNKKEIPVGTFKAILKQSKLSTSDFK
jgi:mRNA interferase HicA